MISRGKRHSYKEHLAYVYIHQFRFICFLLYCSESSWIFFIILRYSFLACNKYLLQYTRLNTAKMRGNMNREHTSIRLAFSMGIFCLVVEVAEASPEVAPPSLIMGLEVFLLLLLRREVNNVIDDLGRKLPFPVVPNGFYKERIETMLKSG